MFAHKFKVHDLIQVDHTNVRAKCNNWLHDIVLEVMETRNDGYKLKYLTPADFFPRNFEILASADFIEDVCHIY